MRKKEGLADYRYFPEPDLPTIQLSEQLIEEVRAASRRPLLLLLLRLQDGLTALCLAGISPASPSCRSHSPVLWARAHPCQPAAMGPGPRQSCKQPPTPPRPPALQVRSSMAELPAARRQRYLALGLPPADVLILADEVATAQYFDAALGQGAAAKAAANWIMGDIMAHCKVGWGWGWAGLGAAWPHPGHTALHCTALHCTALHCTAPRRTTLHRTAPRPLPPQEAKISMDQLALTPAALAEMLSLIEDNTISGKIAKDALPDLLQVRLLPLLLLLLQGPAAGAWALQHCRPGPA
jgi:hypothetical protein